MTGLDVFAVSHRVRPVRGGLGVACCCGWTGLGTAHEWLAVDHLHTVQDDAVVLGLIDDGGPYWQAEGDDA